MATATAIAIRKAEAQERIEKAAHKLGKELGVKAADLNPGHKEPAIAVAVQLEAIADFLEDVVKQLKAKDAPPAEEDKPVEPTVQAQASTGLTVALVNKGKKGGELL